MKPKLVMHGYNQYPKAKREHYEKMLKTVGSLSRLFSENNAPYLDSRVAENLYCLSFGAKNKSRDDSSVDAVFQDTGIGIKTFVGSSNQKVAEFNRDLTLFSNLQTIDKAKKIAELRNKRIEFTKRRYGIEFTIYHCIRREKGKMIITESPLDLINLDKIKIIKANQKTLQFTDGINDYNFNVSKSVLLKSFPKTGIVSEIDVKILADPFNSLSKLMEEHGNILAVQSQEALPYVVLPLYSVENGEYVVPKKSSLNQWNAKGRPRDLDEVYIQVPAIIHRKFPGFFPPRDTKFTLRLPDDGKLSAKICQQNSKALMSDPNKALGQWILRKVLQLSRGKVLTMEMLKEIGIDSVIVRKISEKEFSIDFKEEGGFEKFEEEFLSR